MALPSRPGFPRNLNTVAVLIPAWEPDGSIASLIQSLISLGFGAVVLVDDGSSSSACAVLFEHLATWPGVHLVRHAVNLGKGRALKTGFNYCLLRLPEFEAVVTADADGQHKPSDIVRVAESVVPAEGRIVLGSRTFSREVPLRSKLGNTLTRYIFGFVTGTKLRDTQTGLRAFPCAMLPELMGLEGERYEYEMTMLAHVCRTGKPPLEVPIETVYIDGNKSSHFDPIRDSMRIYFVLARFFLSSIVASGIDFAGFSIAFAATHSVLISVIVGRLSSLVNFALNRKFVFHNRGSVTGALWRYYLLVAVIAALSYALIWTLANRAHWNVFAAKVTVDVLLSLVSFSVQRTFVFRKAEV